MTVQIPATPAQGSTDWYSWAVAMANALVEAQNTIASQATTISDQATTITGLQDDLGTANTTISGQATTITGLQNDLAALPRPVAMPSTATQADKDAAKAAAPDGSVYFEYTP